MAIEDRAALVVGVSEITSENTNNNNNNDDDERNIKIIKAVLELLEGEAITKEVNKSGIPEIKAAMYDSLQVANLLSNNGDKDKSSNFQVTCLLPKSIKIIKGELEEEKKQLEKLEKDELNKCKEQEKKEKIEAKLKKCKRNIEIINEIIKEGSFYEKCESCFEIADKNEIEKELKNLFQSEVSTALFYFSGHANWNESGKYAELIPYDYGSNNYQGIKFDWLLELLISSSVKNKIVILDCCFSGCLGLAPEKFFKDIVLLKDGITLLCSSRNNELSQAKSKEITSFFTNKLISALKGGAANLVGDITTFSLYSFIDEICFYNDQRPILRTSSKADCILRQVSPSIEKDTLGKLVEYFDTEDSKFGLSIFAYPELDNFITKEKVQRIEKDIEKNKNLIENAKYFVYPLEVQLKERNDTNQVNLVQGLYLKENVELSPNQVIELRMKYSLLKQDLPDTKESIYFLLREYRNYILSKNPEAEIKRLEEEIESLNIKAQTNTQNTDKEKYSLSNLIKNIELDLKETGLLKGTETFTLDLDKKVKYYSKSVEDYRNLLLLGMTGKGLVKYVEKKDSEEKHDNNKPSYEIFGKHYEKISANEMSNKEITELSQFIIEYELTELGKYYWQRLRKGIF